MDFPDQSMLQWVYMNVVHAAFAIIFITTGVFVETPLPDPTFAFLLTTF